MNDQTTSVRDEDSGGGVTPNPRRQRRKSARTRIYLAKPGDRDDLRARLWWALERAMRIVQDASNTDQRLRAMSCMSTTAGVYLKSLEVGEMDGRVKAIEAMLAQAKGQVKGERTLMGTLNQRLVKLETEMQTMLCPWCGALLMCPNCTSVGGNLERLSPAHWTRLAGSPAGDRVRG